METMIRVGCMQRRRTLLHNKSKSTQGTGQKTMNSISFTILRRAAASASGAVRAITTNSRGAPVLEAAFVAGRGYIAPRFMSGGSLYAVDAPNGDHDLQDVVREIS